MIPIWGGELDGKYFLPSLETDELFAGPDAWYIFHPDSGDYRVNYQMVEHPPYIAPTQWKYNVHNVLSDTDVMDGS